MRVRYPVCCRILVPCLLGCPFSGPVVALDPVAATGHRPSQMRRPRAREIGIVIGVLPPGPLNAITDVEGVRARRSLLIV